MISKEFTLPLLFEFHTAPWLGIRVCSSNSLVFLLVLFQTSQNIEDYSFLLFFSVDTISMETKVYDLGFKLVGGQYTPRVKDCA